MASAALAASAAATDVQRKGSGRAPPPEIDRTKTCPLLLRVFPKIGDHHHVSEFAERGREPKDEVQIYTWTDASLRELCELVKEVRPEARKPTAKLSFAFVYPDRVGRNVLRPVGTVMSAPHRRGESDEKTLAGLSFQTGDFLDVAIHPNATSSSMHDNRDTRRYK